MNKTLNLSEIVKQSMSDTGLIVKKNVLSEAYHADPKIYGQVTEYLTQRSKDAHIELYEDSVKSLNQVSSELDTVESSDANSRHSDWRSLKLDETYNANSVWLHELFFANMFDPHSEVYLDSIAYLRLERDFGGFDKWQKGFISSALSAGEGWVVTGLNMFLKRYVTTIINHHSDSTMVGLYPLIVLDMWSHTYSRDYLNDKKSFIVSRMREIDWNVVNERFNKAEKIIEAIK